MELLIGLVVGFFIGAYWHRPQSIQTINTGRSKHKEESLDKIMALFDRQDAITNNDIEHLLNVSDATATNYLNELETRGMIVQIGREGRGVTYKRVSSE
ncbi:MAG TPA: hypothetical protein VJC20_01385 [Candidatus Paceibacterota bacterium]